MLFVNLLDCRPGGPRLCSVAALVRRAAALARGALGPQVTAAAALAVGD